MLSVCVKGPAQSLDIFLAPSSPKKEVEKKMEPVKLKIPFPSLARHIISAFLHEQDIWFNIRLDG